MIAKCARCGGEFEQRRSDHRFCNRECRDLGELDPSVDTDAVERLFAEDRDPAERVRPDDWHLDPTSPFAALETYDTVGQRRTWFLRHRELGRLK